MRPAVLALLPCAALWAASAAASSPSLADAPVAGPELALVFGSDPPGESACAAAARRVAVSLQRRHATVTLLVDGSVSDLRGGLADLAERIAGATSPPTAMLYVCAPARIADGRLFVLPAGDAGPTADPLTQGVVAPALFATLAGSQGTVLADLSAPSRPPATLGGGPGRDERTAIHFGQPAPAAEALADAGEAAEAWAAIAAGDARPGRATGGGWLVLPSAPPPSRVASPPPGAAPPLGPAVSSADPPSAIVASALPPPLPPPPGPPAPAAAAPVPPSSGVGPAGETTVATRVATSRATRAANPRPTVGRAARAASRERQTPSPAEDRRGEPASPRYARLQGALARHGLYRGPIDGRPDPSTTEAIEAFQRSLGAAGTGVLSAGQIALLLNS